jgi:tellurite methyltransferase
MRHDVERWNRKYSNRNPHADFAPDILLKNYVHLLDGKGIALDVACGVGHNAIYLAQRGYDVIAVDGSIVGLKYCREEIRRKPLRVSLIAADLERFSLPPEYFDLVLVVRYLFRPLIAQLKTAVTPGGLVIYQTFNSNHLRDNPDFKREYLLEHGELTGWFADFQLIATNDSPGLQDSLSYLIGRKPSRAA